MNIEGKQQSLLTFRVGPVLCCAPSLPVLSIITPPKLTHIAGSDASHPGIFKHGPHIVKVIDLRLKFGIDPSEQTQPGNLIITVIENESFAFWVDQILDVFDFPSEGWGKLPAAIPRGVFTRTLLLNTKIHLYSEFEKLATIHDLGYLKHYIQQLKQQPTGQEEKNTTLDSSDKISTLKPAAQIKALEKDNDQGVRAVEKKQFQRNRPLVAEKKSAPAHATTTSSFIKEKVASATKMASLPRAHKQAIATPNINNEVNAQFKPKLQTTISKPDEKKSFTNITSQTTTSVHSYSNDMEGDTDSSFIGIFLFLMFMFALLGTGLYYLFDDDVINRYEFTNEQHVNTEASFNAEKTQPAEIPLATKQNSIPHITDKPMNTRITNNTSSIRSTPDVKENNTYHADISQLDDEITITIHQPSSPDRHVQQDKQDQPAHADQPIVPMDNEDSENSNDVIKNEPVITSPVVETLKQEELPPALKSEKIIHEVIHTVVKGDTLWAISKKYVHDPFLYPELARLSNIKNPHRIYPGNRVRIRFIKN